MNTGSENDLTKTQDNSVELDGSSLTLTVEPCVSLPPGEGGMDLKMPKPASEYPAVRITIDDLPTSVTNEDTLRDYMTETMRAHLVSVLGQMKEEALEDAEESDGEGYVKTDDVGYYLHGELRIPRRSLSIEDYYDSQVKTAEELMNQLHDLPLPILVRFVLIEVYNLFTEDVHSFGEHVRKVMARAGQMGEIDLIIKANPGLTRQNYMLARRLGRVPTEEDIAQNEKRGGGVPINELVGIFGPQSEPGDDTA